MFACLGCRHAILVPGSNISSNWYGGIVEAIYRAKKGTDSWEEVKKQVSVVVYAVKTATLSLNLSPI